LRGISDELESVKDKGSAGKVAKLRRHSSRIFELKNEVNEIYGLLLLLILTYHNCYLQVDCFNAAMDVYNISRKAWSVQNYSTFAWAFVDFAKAMVYFFAAYKMEYEVKIYNLSSTHTYKDWKL